jgi:hypothetical protein
MERKFVLETLAKQFAENMRTARQLKNQGYEELSQQSYHQALGVHESADALGFTLQEFHDAVKEARRQIREPHGV